MNEIREAVFQALGEASVCWVDGQIPTGIFDSAHATEIGERLCKLIGEKLNGART